jgi:hypothetical protein
MTYHDSLNVNRMRKTIEKEHILFFISKGEK